MKRYEILLFDADNTLFDFSLAERIAFGETAEDAGIPSTDAVYERYSAINDSLWKALERRETTLEELKTERFRRLLCELGCPDDAETAARARRMRERYIESLSHQACLVDGAEELCRDLAREYPLYLVTNGISRIQRSRFDASALKPYFSGIFVSEELGEQKPSPAYFDAVFAAIGNPERDKVLMIGDSLTSDCDGAIAYGIDICRYNPKNEPDGGRPITYTVTKLSEIRDILCEGTK